MTKTLAEHSEKNTAKESFADLLEQSFKSQATFEGSVVTGRVVGIDGESVIVDVGLKSEGRIPLKEFTRTSATPDIKIGDTIEVFVERLEDKNGDAVLSRDKARREEAWQQLEVMHKNNEKVIGTIVGKVKGGFTVDVDGAIAFLPGSQVDIRPIKDINPLMGQAQPFQILKMDKARGNIVVSRRAILEETRAEARTELVANLKEGQLLQGVVKNITDYGAFIDLGGVDGLLHVTDIAWRRVNHPSEVLQVGQTIDCQIIKFNSDNQRISLGMKQLENDPWVGVNSRYSVSQKLTGRVTNITDYGAFVELEPGVEGLVHVSEMSWTKKNIHPSKIVSTSQEVEVVILEVDETKRRISLGIKQCSENPWQKFADSYPAGTELEGEIKNVTEFGLFVGLPGEIDGMIHMSDLSWEKSGEEAIKEYKKGQKISVKVLEVDVTKERVSLGVKQLTSDPFESALSGLKKGDVVTCVVSDIKESGLEVKVKDTLSGFIKKAELAREKSEQRTDKFSVGDKIDAKVTAVDRNSRKLSLSVRSKEIEEEKEAMATYGSSDSGASLGEILGEALNKAETKKSKKKEE